eukprot:15481643-Alexandrium_andersonii.AAC.1
MACSSAPVAEDPPSAPGGPAINRARSTSSSLPPTKMCSFRVGGSRPCLRRDAGSGSLTAGGLRQP